MEIRNVCGAKVGHRLARFLSGHHLLYKFSPASRIDKMPGSRVIWFSFSHKKRDCLSEMGAIKLYAFTLSHPVNPIYILY